MRLYSIAVSVFFGYSSIGWLALDTNVFSSTLGNSFQVPSEKYELKEATNKLEPVKQLKPNEPNSQQIQTVKPDNQKLTQCLRTIRNSRVPDNNGVNSIVSSNNLGRSDSIVDLNSGTGSGVGSDTPRNRQRVSTGLTPPQVNTSSSNHRAACREGGCNTRYPESARRQSMEGRVELAIDTDALGNVTSVRLLRSSGNPNLDEETLRQARNWKLKPTSGGRKGVLIKTEYALAGSCRHLQLQERSRRGSSETKN
ncbi:MAG: energy transducer TonB [Nostoc sp. S4]|nr:energy transducer TonB [Nostoc sp. S4]